MVKELAPMLDILVLFGILTSHGTLQNWSHRLVILLSKYNFEFLQIPFLLLQVWDVETGRNLGTRKVATVGRSISFSYSGNLVAYTTTMVAMTQPMLFVADLRDPDQLNGERAVGQATLGVSSNCCVFSHLDDTVIVGTEECF